MKGEQAADYSILQFEGAVLDTKRYSNLVGYPFIWRFLMNQISALTTFGIWEKLFSYLSLLVFQISQKKLVCEWQWLGVDWLIIEWLFHLRPHYGEASLCLGLILCDGLEFCENFILCFMVDPGSGFRHTCHTWEAWLFMNHLRVFYAMSTGVISRCDVSLKTQSTLLRLAGFGNPTCTRLGGLDAQLHSFISVFIHSGFTLCKHC